MEKRISYSQFQQVKAAAKMIDPLQRKMAPVKKKIEALVGELRSYQTQVDALEAGIVSILGFHVTDLVKKVIEPTGKTDAKTGKPVMVTKYIPTSIVSYDDHKKEFVVSCGGEDTTIPSTEGVAGSDYDIDREEEQNEVEAEATAMPWEN